MALHVALSADDKRGRDIVILDLHGISLMADYFIIVDAETEVQVRAIADGIRSDLDDHGVVVKAREGWEDARWVLLDYGDIIVHIFRSEEREYYDLERLWGDAPRLTLNEEGTALVSDG